MAITNSTKVSFTYVPKTKNLPQNPSDNIIYFIADEQKIYFDGVYYGYADGDFSLNQVVISGSGNAITGLTAEGKTITATKEISFATQFEMDLVSSSLLSLTGQIQGLQGAFVYIGKILESTSSVNPTKLNARIQALVGRPPKIGDVLVDNDNIEWYYNGTTWNEYGQGEIGVASNNNFGLIRTNYQNNNKNYGIKVDANGDAYVNVPWADSIAYTAEDGIKLDGTIFKHTNNVTASNAGPSANASPGYGGTFTVPYIVYDKHGHITSRTNRTITLPAAQTIPNLSGGASAATGKYVSGVTVSGHAVTVTQENLPTLIESANKLNTARNIKIGEQSLSFDGTASLVYNLNDIFNFDNDEYGIIRKLENGGYFIDSSFYLKTIKDSSNRITLGLNDQEHIKEIFFKNSSHSTNYNKIWIEEEVDSYDEIRNTLNLLGNNGIIFHNLARYNNANIYISDNAQLTHKKYVDDKVSSESLKWTVVS